VKIVEKLIYLDKIELCKKDFGYFIETILGIQVPLYQKIVLKQFNKMKDKEFIGWDQNMKPVWIDKK
jgi:hypothetical protein